MYQPFVQLQIQTMRNFLAKESFDSQRIFETRQHRKLFHMNFRLSCYMLQPPPPPPSHTALEKCNFHRRRRFHSNVQQINRIKFFFYFNVSVSSHKECVFFFFSVVRRRYRFLSHCQRKVMGVVELKLWIFFRAYYLEICMILEFAEK